MEFTHSIRSPQLTCMMFPHHPSEKWWATDTALGLFVGQSRAQQDFPNGASGKEHDFQCRRHMRIQLDPWKGKIPWRRTWQPTPIFLPGGSHEQRSLAGYSPWGHKEWDMAQVTSHTCQGSAVLATSGTLIQPSSSLFPFSLVFPRKLSDFLPTDFFFLIIYFGCAESLLLCAGFSSCHVGQFSHNVGSKLPNRESNPCPLHWKVAS